MGSKRFVANSALTATAQEVWDWHLRPGALQRLTPSWDGVEIVANSGPLCEGARVEMRVPAGPFKLRWVALHRDFVEGSAFTDVQEQGPFAHWSHEHRFRPRDDGGSDLEDAIEYALPLGGALGGGVVRRKLQRLFRWRHAVTRTDLERHAERAGAPRLHVAISGASGLVGSALSAFLTTGGHQVRRLVRRRPTSENEVFYNPETDEIDRDGLEGLDAVVHLAGEGIAGGRWTAERKRRIRDSRVRGTGLIAGALAELKRPPRVLVNASAIGFYGDRGEEKLDESSAPGTGFLPEVCQEWEAATAPAAKAGLRVVRLRIGVVQAAAGGALAATLPLFRVGLGGPIGLGRRFVSWIALDDLVGAIHFALFEDALDGAVNAVAPTPLRNAEMTRTLAGILRMPAFAPAPPPIMRLALGEMAEELLLTSNRIYPRALEEGGFRFSHPDLEDALRFELGRVAPSSDDPEFR